MRGPEGSEARDRGRVGLRGLGKGLWGLVSGQSASGGRIRSWGDDGVMAQDNMNVLDVRSALCAAHPTVAGGGRCCFPHFTMVKKKRPT